MPDLMGACSTLARNLAVLGKGVESIPAEQSPTIQWILS